MKIHKYITLLPEISLEKRMAKTPHVVSELVKFYDSISGQIKQELPRSQVYFTEIQGPWDINRPTLLIEVEHFKKSKSLLQICSPPIKKETDGWFVIMKTASQKYTKEETDKILGKTDGLLNCYGPAALGIETAPDSKGNQRTGSYRRISHIKNLIYSNGMFEEIPFYFSENNIRLWWEGKPLENICDHLKDRLGV